MPQAQVPASEAPKVNYGEEIRKLLDTAFELRTAIESIRPGLTLDTIESADAAGFTSYEVSCPDTEDLGEPLVRALTAASALRLRACSRTEATLEHVFLAATRRSWDATLDDKKTGAKT